MSICLFKIKFLPKNKGVKPMTRTIHMIRKKIKSPVLTFLLNMACWDLHTEYKILFQNIKKWNVPYLDQETNREQNKYSFKKTIFQNVIINCDLFHRFIISKVLDLGKIQCFRRSEKRKSLCKLTQSLTFPIRTP